MNILLIILLILCIIFFNIINYTLKNKEMFCYSNNYCNGNKDSKLCINQQCRVCGLQSSCNKDSDCGPNNCIDGCCDQL